jgi:uncharacterized protein (DUF169 family)
MDESSSNMAHFQIIKEFLGLRFPPVALKLVEDGDVVTETVYRPSAHGRHLALCQAFALARRDGKTIYMGKKDHWCWNPLITFGHVKCEAKGDPGFETICAAVGIEDPAIAEQFVSSYMKLPYRKYDGVVVAPLDRADFPPDVLMIYCEPGQLRTILLALKRSGRLVRSEFDALDSCLYATIPPFLTGEYRITVPDIGEYERALTDDHTMIFSVPAARIDEFFDLVGKLLESGRSYRSFPPAINEDFPRPPFYEEVFSAWGLDAREDGER